MTKINHILPAVVPGDRVATYAASTQSAWGRLQINTRIGVVFMPVLDVTIG